MIQTSLGKKPLAEDTIMSVLDTLKGESHDRIALAILTRLRRSYNQLVLDGTEYALVPLAKKDAS